MKPASRPLHFAAWGLLVILAVGLVGSNLLSIRRVPASDFYQFWVVGRELEAGRAADIYSPGERERVGARYLALARRGGDSMAIRTALQRETLETFSTPFLYSLFSAFSSPDYARDLALYRLVSVASTLLAVLALCRLLGYGALATTLAIAIVGALFAPTRSDWFVGNVNGLQLGLLTLFVWLSARRPSATGYLLGGLVLGTGAMFKPNSSLAIAALLVAWGMGQRLEKLLCVVVGMVAAILVAFVSSSVAFGGPSIWQSWFDALSILPDEIITVDLGNYAAPRLVTEWIGIDASLGMSLLCGGLLLGVMTRVFQAIDASASPGRDGLEDLHVIALASLVTLLASPLSWLHYYVATVPMLLVVLRPDARLALPGSRRIVPPPVTRSLAAIALVAIMMRPLVVLELGDDRSRAVLLCLGTALLFGLGLLSLLGLRTRTDPERDVGT